MQYELHVTVIDQLSYVDFKKITVQALVPQWTSKLPQENLYTWLQIRRNTCVFLIMTLIVISQTYWVDYVKYSSTHDDLLHVLPSHAFACMEDSCPCEWINLSWICTTYCILYIHIYICIGTQHCIYIYVRKTILN